MLARLSWRNIWRNKVRSLVVIFAIAVGLTGGIFITGMMNGMVAQQTTNAINSEISDIQIHNPGFLENNSPTFLIDDVDQKIKTIKSNPLVTEASYRSKSTAMASTATKGAGATIFGIIPSMEKKVTSIHEKIVKGDYFETETKSQAIVIGEKLSHKLNADIGKKIVVTSQALNGEMSWSLYRVVGIFKTNDTRFDETNMFVQKEDLDKALGIGINQANEIAIRTTTQDIAPIVTKELIKKYSELSINSWSEINPSLIVMRSIINKYSLWLIFIILFVLSFVIVKIMPKKKGIKFLYMVIFIAISMGLAEIIVRAITEKYNHVINNEISDIQIHNKQFLKTKNPKYLISDVYAKLNRINQESNITASCFRTIAQVKSRSHNKNAEVTIMGIVPELETKVTDIYSCIIKGTYFETDTVSQPIIISEKLADKLNVDIGKEISMDFSNINQDQIDVSFRIVGIYKTNASSFDERNVFVLWKQLNLCLNIVGNQANEIAIRTTSQNVAKQTAKEISNEYSKISIQSWREIKPSLIVMMTMMDQFGYWLMIIILFALIFGIINTMLMVIMERKKELGMLMSVGMNKQRVFRMIMLETTMLSLVGAIIGLIISISLMQLFGSTGINFASWAEGLEAVGYSSFVYPYVTTDFYITVTILVIITAMTASIWPTRKALKLNPAEAVRAE